MPQDKIAYPEDSFKFNFSQIHFANLNKANTEDEHFDVRTNSLEEFKKNCAQLSKESNQQLKEFLVQKIKKWKDDNITIFIASGSDNNIRQFEFLLEGHDFLIRQYSGDEEYLYSNEVTNQRKNPLQIAIIKRELADSLHLKDDHIVFVSLSDILGKKKSTNKKSKNNSFKKAKALHFSDLKPGDFIVHKEHGVGLYNGLTLMPIALSLIHI